MEKEIIEAMVASTPRSELGTVQADHEIWEEEANGCRYMVTRYVIPGSQQEAIFLSVSGAAKDRLTIVREFNGVLGAPVQGDLRPKDDGHVDMVSWLV